MNRWNRLMVGQSTMRRHVLAVEKTYEISAIQSMGQIPDPWNFFRKETEP